MWGNKKLHRRDDAIKIPSGYIRYSEYTREHPEATEEEIKDRMRYLTGSTRREIDFIFDPNNENYQKFLEKCREDTKNLKRALQEELDTRGIEVWVKGGAPPASKRDYHQMSFLIRPPFFASYEDKNPETRMQRSDNRDNFILHFDENNYLQCVRVWESNIPWRASARQGIAGNIEKSRKILQTNYGNWQIIVKFLADQIESYLKFLKAISQVDFK